MFSPMPGRLNLTLTGGYLYPRTRVMVGPLCEHMLGTVRADTLIMGIGGVTEAGYSNNNTLVVGPERKDDRSTLRSVIVVADRSKFGKSAMIPVAPLDVADLVVTDSGLAARYQADAARAQCRSSAGIRGPETRRYQAVRISLFITCYNDTLFPETGKAVVSVLERLGHTVEFRRGQTCCGQMHYNTGYQRRSAAADASVSWSCSTTPKSSASPPPPAWP